MKSLIESRKEHEGFSKTPYIDPLAKDKISEFDYLVIKENLDKVKPTFGYGFTYITQDEAEYVLRNRLAHLQIELEDKLSMFNRLSKKRQEVLVEMAYQLGVAGLLKFKKMHQALKDGDYIKASREMLDSVWARQTPNRANELANKMAQG